MINEVVDIFVKKDLVLEHEKIQQNIQSQNSVAEMFIPAESEETFQIKTFFFFAIAYVCNILKA